MSLYYLLSVFLISEVMDLERDNLGHSLGWNYSNGVIYWQSDRTQQR